MKIYWIKAPVDSSFDINKKQLAVYWGDKKICNLIVGFSIDCIILVDTLYEDTGQITRDKDMNQLTDPQKITRNRS